MKENTSGSSKDEVISKKFLNNSIGIETTGGKFTSILERGLSLPCQKKEIFSTTEDNQASIVIHVFQGDSNFVTDPSIKEIGKFTLKDIPKADAGKPQIEVIFSVNRDGKFYINAKDAPTSKTIEVSKAASDSDSEQPAIDITEKLDPLTPKHPQSIGDAVGIGAFGGAVAGLAAHYFAAGKMTFLIFIVAYILILSQLKGKGKLIGLIVFTIIAAIVVVVFQHFDPGQ